MPYLTYAKATDYLRHCIGTPNIPTSFTRSFEIRLILPSSSGTGPTVSTLLTSKCFLTLRTTLDRLILMIQIEVDLFLSRKENETRLVCAIEIEMTDDVLPGMPPLKGEIVHGSGFGHDSPVETALCVAWECRNGVMGGSVGCYWDTYRAWLLKLAGTSSKNPVFKVWTVLQQDSEKAGRGGGGGHHFVRAMEELIDAKDVGKGPATNQDESADEKRKSQPRVNVKEVIKKSPRVKQPTQEETDHQNIDSLFLVNLRSNLESNSEGVSFRPTTPELLMANKIINHRRDNSEETPTYNELVEIREAMRRGGYGGLPSWVSKMSFKSDGENDVKKSTIQNERRRVTWGSYQRLGGQEDVHQMFNFEHTPFLDEIEWTPVDYNNPNYKDSFGLQQTKECEQETNTAEDSGVKMVPYYEFGSDEILEIMDIMREVIETPPKLVCYRGILGKAKGFSPEDDEMFLIGEQPTAAMNEKSKFDNQTTSNDITGSPFAKLGIDITSMGFQRYPNGIVGVSERVNDDMMLTDGSAPTARPFAFLNQEQGQASPHLSAQAPIFQSPASTGVMGIANLTTYPGMAQTVALNNGDWTSSPQAQADFNYHYPQSPAAHSNFNPSTPSFQYQSGFLGHTNTQLPIAPQSQSPLPFLGAGVPPVHPTHTIFQSKSLSANRLTSPFAHRFPYRLDPNNGVHAGGNNMKPNLPQNVFPNPLNSTPPPGFGIPQTGQNMPHHSSPLRNPPIAPRAMMPLENTILTDSDVLDPAYGTSLRLHGNELRVEIDPFGEAQVVRSILHDNSQPYTSKPYSS